MILVLFLSHTLVTINQHVETANVFSVTEVGTIGECFELFSMRVVTIELSLSIRKFQN